MNSIVFLIMRRMRLPLMVLLTVYALAMVGMTLMPGVDDQGNLWYMDFFHAFYFVSYMGTTIGFGEIPYAFSGAQRMWATFSLYLTVVAWIYAIGALLALLQDEALKRTLVERQFSRTVSNIHEPFYLICGYGDTGQALVSSLEERFLRAVVIEKSQDRINSLIMENYPVYVPKLCADASQPLHLIEGGLRNKYCSAIVAITNDNNINLNIAITTKLLNPQLPVICRVDSNEVAANMATFEADFIINPFTIFARLLHIILHSPSLFLLREWLIGKRNIPMNDKLLSPPQHGLWILCGYGRFGQEVCKQLEREVNIRIVIVEANLSETGYPREEYVIGRGMETEVLKEANIDQAVGIVAGTNDDMHNLAIVMAARQLNPNLYVIIRQNDAANQVIFDAAQAEIVMQASQIIADHIRILLMSPLLADFIRESKLRGNHWANYVISRMIGVIPEHDSPTVWETVITQQQAPALYQALYNDQSANINTLLRDPKNRDENLSCIALMLIRGDERILLPDETECLMKGDTLLWCGQRRASINMEWTLQDSFVFAYVSRGIIMPRSIVWQWLHKGLTRQN
ncbi:NAD-binding protein [Candidatus Albibeggiatoa sp. nov. NOAA]|uniref:potassium channel family protein n=1 Tax=Candidatus Albibeggiatoa sp. nov. NOAA TaxID=3162724 RepID=UPI0032F7874A|nr:NAD-binding protein [Thiotrichaceae bacterium]